MMNTELKQTVFHIEKLRNVVNVSGSSAYQIFTYPGDVVGRFGTIENSEQNPANEENIHASRIVNTCLQASPSFIRKAFLALLG